MCHTGHMPSELIYNIIHFCFSIQTMRLLFPMVKFCWWSIQRKRAVVKWQKKGNSLMKNSTKKYLWLKTDGNSHTTQKIYFRISVVRKVALQWFTALRSFVLGPPALASSRLNLCGPFILVTSITERSICKQGLCTSQWI